MRKRRPLGLNPEELLTWIMEQTVEEPAPYSNLSQPCHIWQGLLDTHGYGAIALKTLGWGHQKVHRVAHAIRTNVPVNSLRIMCHLCDRPACIEGSHLVEGDHSLNMSHMHERGRAVQIRGSQVDSAKLTEMQALAIRDSSLFGVAETGRMFGVSTMTVRSIRQGKTWKHATVEWCLTHLTNLDDEIILDLIAATEDTEAA